MVWSFFGWKCLTTRVVSNGVVFQQMKMWSYNSSGFKWCGLSSDENVNHATGVVSDGVVFHQAKCGLKQEWFLAVWSFIRASTMFRYCCPVFFVFCFVVDIMRCLSAWAASRSIALLPFVPNTRTPPPPPCDIQRPPCTLPCCQTKTRSIIQACRGWTFSAGLPG